MVPYTTLKLMIRLNERESFTLSLFFSSVRLAIGSPKEHWMIYDAKVCQEECFFLNKVKAINSKFVGLNLFHLFKTYQTFLA